MNKQLELKKMYGFGGPFGGDPNYVQGVAQKLGGMLVAIALSGKASAIYWAVSPDGGKIEEIGEYSEQDWQDKAIASPHIKSA
ncbi:hypothetical protein [Spirulina sp. 06S082]|uniref:hypothetical protein n=1 Tax=Spirulina sp. 06S082 TaxID=3110248 RepID=UPI002B2187BB|nr:hypothetical protein [Spirulina sp. 06S082]MEA5469739.1 hypothetical protein [Spirulina sp. 06S082]